MDGEQAVVAYDQGDPTGPPGECYLTGASWVGRGGKPTYVSGIGVFRDMGQCMEAMTTALVSIHGHHKLASLWKNNRIFAEARTIEPEDLEQMAALVRQHRAAQATQA